MKILHLNAGNETGGGMHHILSLLKQLNRKEVILGVCEEGELLKRAQNAGIKTVYFPNKTRMSLALIYKMARYIMDEKIDYVHTHGPRANVYGSILKKFVPFHWVVTVHSDPQLDFMGSGIIGNLYGRLNLQAIKLADKIIAISEPFKKNLVLSGVNRNQITTALNGIDFNKQIDTHYRKQDFGIRQETFLFLQVARLEAVKGHHIAFKALANLVKHRKDCQLMLLGDGSLKEELRNLAKELGIIDYIHFLGHRTDAEKFYKMADITLLTSVSESFPLVLLESARVQTPIITSRVGGVDELVQGHTGGWITEPGNVEELTKAMEDAYKLSAKGSLSTIGDNLHAHASTKFTLETFADSIYHVYLSMNDIR